MVFLIISWLIIVIPGFVLGLLVTGEKPDCFNSIEDRYIFAACLGAELLGLILYSLSLFVRLSSMIGLATMAACLCLTLSFGWLRFEIKDFSQGLKIKRIIVFCAVSLIIAAKCTKSVYLHDTGLYHFQAIKWLAKYGVVPGLALIHDRLGYISTWFGLAAPFHFEPFELHIGAILGGYITILLILQIIIVANRIVKRSAYPEDYFVLMPLLLVLHYALVTEMERSPSPDLPVLFMTVLFVNLLLVISRKERGPDKIINWRSRYTLLATGAIAATIKVTALPVLAISIIFWMKGGLSRKQGIAGCALAGFLLAPYLAGSVITSGCAIYPVSRSCLNLPWSVEAKSAEITTNETTNYWRWGSYDDRKGVGASWLVQWAKKNVNSALLIFASFACLLVFLRFGGRRLIAGQWYVITLSLIGILLVLTGAPGMRFGLVYFALIPALLAQLYPGVLYPLILACYITQGAATNPIGTGATVTLKTAILVFSGILFVIGLVKIRDRVSATVSLVSACLLALFAIRILLVGIGERIVVGDFLSAKLVPPAIVQLRDDQFAERQINDVRYKVPLVMLNSPDSPCWSAELPCTPRLNRHDIELRNPKVGIAAGFQHR